MLSFVISVGLCFIAFLFLCSCLFIVEPNQARFVFTWVGGAVHHTVTTPGLKVKMPWPFQSVSESYSLAEMMIPARNRCRSSDEAFFDLEVTAVVQRDRRRVEEAVFNMEQPIEQIKVSVSEAVKRVVPTLELAEVYSDREKIRDEVKDSLNAIYEKHGFECVQVLVEDPKLEESMEKASNQRIENRRRAEAAKDLKEAIFLEQTADAEAAAESLRLRSKAAGESKALYTKEIIKSLNDFRKAHGDLNPQMIMDAMEGLDRRDSIITASGKEGNIVVVDTNNDRGRQYADMSAFSAAQDQKGKKPASTRARKTTASKASASESA